MKRIQKGRTPAALNRWIKQQNGINCSYDDIPSNIKYEIWKRLVQDQGGLCCYTGIRLVPADCHIEHLKPQALCEDGKEDVDYRNLLAAYPKDKMSNGEQCPFGAKVRGDWYNEDEFVHPLRPDCEQRFKFSLEGEITPVKEDDIGACETIKNLKLDSEQLNQMRYDSIDELLFPSGRELSDAKARRILERLSERDDQGNFAEFCFVLAQVCREYLRRRKQSRIRCQAIRQQQR